MGRAYEVRKASIQKTGAAKAKLYSMYAREIYQAARNGGVEFEGNPTLKRLVEKAKKEQVPNDIINRAIDKVNSGADETYTSANYEIFGPAGSTAIVSCLTDNVNRSVSSVRAVINKCHVKMGNQGSVSYMYDHLCLVSFKGLSEEEALDALLEASVDVVDIETDNDEVVVYGEPNDLNNIKEAIMTKLPNVSFDLDEISMFPKEKVTLTGEDKETFERMLSLLDEVEDVQHVYHNVELWGSFFYNNINLVIIFLNLFIIKMGDENEWKWRVIKLYLSDL